MRMGGSMRIDEIHAKLQSLSDPGRAAVLRRFFKTGPGQYGEGDVFLGLRVPQIRKLAGICRTLPLEETLRLLQSPIHEARLLALIIMVRMYVRGDVAMKEAIYGEYLRNTRFVNSWDLVDVSAEHIVGAHLRSGSRSRLHALAVSPLLWDRRISIMATFHFIKHAEFEETLNIAQLLLHDPEDLIHKAVGWMLREIGKRHRPTEERFLREHCRSMPRTMLRYAVERFPEELRQRYLRGEIPARELLSP